MGVTCYYKLTFTFCFSLSAFSLSCFSLSAFSFSAYGRHSLLVIVLVYLLFFFFGLFLFLVSLFFVVLFLISLFFLSLIKTLLVTINYVVYLLLFLFRLVFFFVRLFLVFSSKSKSNGRHSNRQSSLSLFYKNLRNFTEISFLPFSSSSSECLSLFSLSALSLLYPWALLQITYIPFTLFNPKPGNLTFPPVFFLASLWLKSTFHC